MVKIWDKQAYWVSLNHKLQAHDFQILYKRTGEAEWYEVYWIGSTYKHLISHKIVK